MGFSLQEVLKKEGILLAMYGPAADVKEKSFVQRRGTDAVMYPASESRFLVSCGP
jgi:hypothetical protein